MLYLYISVCALYMRERGEREGERESEGERGRERERERGREYWKLKQSSASFSSKFLKESITIQI